MKGQKKSHVAKTSFIKFQKLWMKKNSNNVLGTLNFLAAPFLDIPFVTAKIAAFIASSVYTGTFCFGAIIVNLPIYCKIGQKNESDNSCKEEKKIHYIIGIFDDAFKNTSLYYHHKYDEVSMLYI